MKKILFTIGSHNQTTQMHAIASMLPEYDCYFSQFYSDNILINFVIRLGLADTTILSGQFKRTADAYLETHHLKNDYAQGLYGNTYDLVVVCSDLLVPKAIRQTKSIWVQEGMTDRLSVWSKMVKRLDLPRYWAVGTSLNGTSGLCDIHCIASEGYREHFSSLGTPEDSLVVTGIPNFDNIDAQTTGEFPHRNYVLIATSDIRECMGFDNRPEFLRMATAIANGREMIFKLHPNEKVERAVHEIKQFAPPDSLIFTEGNINPMIAHCDELITQYSTVVYTGLALGKKVHSYFNIDDLRRKQPLQNGGTSAAQIAEICRRYIEYKGSRQTFLREEIPLATSQYQKIAC